MEYDEYIKVQLNAGKQSKDPFRFMVAYLKWSGIYDLPKDVMFLDAGCGQGRILRHLSEYKFINLHGVDISDFKLGNLKEKYGLEVKHCDIHHLNDLEKGYPSDTFDFIYSTHTIEHMLYVDVALEAMYGVLKPGGRSIVVVPYPEPNQAKYNKIHCGKFQLKSDWETAINDPEGNGISEVFERVGFKIIKKLIVTQTNKVAEIWDVAVQRNMRQDEIWLLLEK